MTTQSSGVWRAGAWGLGILVALGLLAIGLLALLMPSEPLPGAAAVAAADAPRKPTSAITASPPAAPAAEAALPAPVARPAPPTALPAAPPPKVAMAAPANPPVARAVAPVAEPPQARAPVAIEAGFTGFRGSVVRFASLEEGRAMLGADDAYIAASGELQRSSLLGLPAGSPRATRDAFRALQAASVQPWPAAMRARMQHALETVAPQFNRLGISLPPEVLLVSTNGRESAGIPHTRANVVVFPMRFDQQSFSDVELMAHELYHIVSRYNPGLRTRLYATLGFTAVAPLQWPAAWLPLRVANQDAPHHEHALWLTLEGRRVALMPVVVVDPAELKSGGSIVTAADARLLEVTPGTGGEPTRPVLRDGAPVWHDPETTRPYLDALGGNSDYLVHPEETMADNVMFLVSGRKVPNPALLQRIEAALRAGN